MDEKPVPLTSFEETKVAFGRLVRTGRNRIYRFYSMFGMFYKQNRTVLDIKKWNILILLKGVKPKRTERPVPFTHQTLPENAKTHNKNHIYKDISDLIKMLQKLKKIIIMKMNTKVETYVPPKAAPVLVQN